MNSFGNIVGSLATLVIIGILSAVGSSLMVFKIFYDDNNDQYVTDYQVIISQQSNLVIMEHLLSVMEDKVKIEEKKLFDNPEDVNSETIGKVLHNTVLVNSHKHEISLLRETIEYQKKELIRIYGDRAKEDLEIWERYKERELKNKIE